LINDVNALRKELNDTKRELNSYKLQETTQLDAFKKSKAYKDWEKEKEKGH